MPKTPPFAQTFPSPLYSTPKPSPPNTPKSPPHTPTPFPYLVLFAKKKHVTAPEFRGFDLGEDMNEVFCALIEAGLMYRDALGFYVPRIIVRDLL